MSSSQHQHVRDEDVENLGVGTKLISLKCKPLEMENKPVVTPIYQSSTYLTQSCDTFKKQQTSGLVYSRVGTPNSMEVEMVLAKLEGGVGALVYAGGMVAVTGTVMCFLRPGDHLVTHKPLYSGSHVLIHQYLPTYGIEVTEVSLPKDDKEDLAEKFRSVTRPNTKLYLAETPCNPTMQLFDLENLAKLGEEMGIITAVDSTFASPINQLPLKLGIDISIHSCTKYMGGHSDLLAGCTIFRKQEHYEKMSMYRMFFTSPLDPANCALLLRSLRTLHIRVQKHNENAQAVAEFLEGHPKVKRVLYPGLKSHPHHHLAKKQMMGFGGMMTVVFESEEESKKFVEKTKVFHFAVSLGGVESLIEHVCTMTHGDWAMTDQDRKELGIEKGMVRLSIGIEDIKDIIADLTQALEKMSTNEQ